MDVLHSADTSSILVLSLGYLTKKHRYGYGHRHGKRYFQKSENAGATGYDKKNI